MLIREAAFLVGAGLATGGVNAIAGGGTLFTYPVLLATGAPPVVANVTKGVAAFPGYLASVAGSRTELTGQRHRLLALVPTAVAGGALGCALLLLTPARAFEVVVPFLVLGATAVLAFQGRLRALVEQPHPELGDGPRRKLALHGLTGMSAVYGGYFGAALGVILVAVLGVLLHEPLARVNALKNGISAAVGFTTAAVFAVFGPVDWLAAAVLAPAALVGGYLGARLSPHIPARVLRAVIVVAGTTIGLVLLVQLARS